MITTLVRRLIVVVPTVLFVPALAAPAIAQSNIFQRRRKTGRRGREHGYRDPAWRGRRDISKRQHYAAGGGPRSIVADFNEDGALDVDFVAAISGSSNVAVFAGNGDGSFQAARTYPAGLSPKAVVIVDLNGDGIPDVATAHAGPLGGDGHGRVSALLGNGDGTLQAAQTFVGETPRALVAADFDGDGTPDLATSNIESNNVSVLLNDGSGSFHPSIEFGAGSDAGALAAGDFDADGRQDIAFVNQPSDPTRDLSILINDTAPPPPPPTFHELAVGKDGNGGGTVASTSEPESWSQIDCGDTCTATYVSGTVVTLTVQADAGSTFGGWSGCDDVAGNVCTVSMKRGEVGDGDVRARALHALGQ